MSTSRPSNIFVSMHNIFWNIVTMVAVDIIYYRSSSFFNGNVSFGL